jgi:DNA-binding CsgD family transcriptional regulator
MRDTPGICDDELLTLIKLIYESAEDATLWSVILERLAILLRATVGTLDLYDTSEKSGNITASVNVDPEFTQEYVAYYASKNLWLNYHPGGVPFGRALSGQMLVPDDVLFRSEFYQDFLRCRDLFHLAGGQIMQEKTLAANVSLLRSRNSGPFGDAELNFLDLLLPHLGQALQLHCRISRAEVDQMATAEALDQMPFGVLQVDRFARVLSANRRGREMLASRDGLFSDSQGLRAASPAQTAHLKSLIAGAAATSLGEGLEPGGSLLLDRPSLRQPLAIRVLPLRTRSCLLDHPRPAAVVFVSDPEAHPAPNQILSLYHLTPAEERLATLLAQGESLKEAAESLGISRNTAATQLKSVFQKTGTHRQADLVRLVLGSVGSLLS